MVKLLSVVCGELIVSRSLSYVFCNTKKCCWRRFIIFTPNIYYRAK